MKQMKIALVAILATIMGTTFTSCLSSDNGNSPDGYASATVNYAGTSLLLDGGFTFNIANPSKLMNTTTGKFPERVYISFKYAEGDGYVEGKTTYNNVTILDFDSWDPVIKIFCDKDTLGQVSGVLPNEGQPIYQFTTDYWGANGYVVIGFVATTDSKTRNSHFDMYPEDVKDGVLYLKLHHNQKVTNGSLQSGFMNFKYLSVSTLEYALGSKYDDLEFTDGDYINVVVVADNGNDNQIKTSAVKMKVMD